MKTKTVKAILCESKYTDLRRGDAGCRPASIHFSSASPGEDSEPWEGDPTCCKKKKTLLCSTPVRRLLLKNLECVASGFHSPTWSPCLIISYEFFLRLYSFCLSYNAASTCVCKCQRHHVLCAPLYLLRSTLRRGECTKDKTKWIDKWMRKRSIKNRGMN